MFTWAIYIWKKSFTWLANKHRLGKAQRPKQPTYTAISVTNYHQVAYWQALKSYRIGRTNCLLLTLDSMPTTNPLLSFLVCMWKRKGSTLIPRFRTTPGPDLQDHGQWHTRPVWGQPEPLTWPRWLKQLTTRYTYRIVPNLRTLMNT